MGEMISLFGNNSDIISLLRSNTKFSQLKGLDLEELINLIESFYLIYRPTLNLDDNVTFGTEIEYEKLSRLFVNDYFKSNLTDWKSTYDDSIKNGGEVISPKLIDSKKTWQELQVICNFLKENNAQALDRTGAHIHAGAHIFDGDKEKCFDFLQTYIAYEKVLTRFFYGEYLNGRTYIDTDMKYMIKKFLYCGYDYEIGNLFGISLDDFLKKLDKEGLVRTSHADLSGIEKPGNTIELRIPNGTNEEIIWQNNINAYTKLLLAIKNNIVDMDLVRHKIKGEFINNLNDKNLYNKIYVDDTLEFVDMIFDNNLDKVYFLRQYFKNFETVLDSKQLVKATSFINKPNITINKIA